MKASAANVKTVDIHEMEDCLEKAIKEITTTMFDCNSEIIPFELVDLIPPGLSAIIGFGGKISGNISIHLSPDNACKLASNMLGMEITEMDDIVADAIGEMVNMLAGGMKKYACKHEDLFKISVPSIVYGSDYSTHSPKDSDRLLIGIKTGSSTYSIQLIFAHS